MTLSELGNKYHTDKVIAGYTDAYAPLFDPSKVKLVLELGIGTYECMTHFPGYVVGASLRMWEEYFPYAQIVGIDKDPRSMVTGDRIHSFVADQRNAESLLRAVNGYAYFDLILDDAEHTAEAQLAALGTLYPRLKRSGYYIIEDVADPVNVCRGMTLNYTLTKLPRGGVFVTIPGGQRG